MLSGGVWAPSSTWRAGLPLNWRVLLPTDQPPAVFYSCLCAEMLCLKLSIQLGSDLAVFVCVPVFLEFVFVLLVFFKKGLCLSCYLCEAKASVSYLSFWVWGVLRSLMFASCRGIVLIVGNLVVISHYVFPSSLATWLFLFDFFLLVILLPLPLFLYRQHSGLWLCEEFLTAALFSFLPFLKPHQSSELSTTADLHLVRSPILQSNGQQLLDYGSPISSRQFAAATLRK